MKNLKFLVVLLATVLLAIAMCVGASATQTDVPIQSAYNFAEEFLIKYYRAMDLNESHDFSEYIQIPTLRNYVEGRIEHYWYAKTLYRSKQRENYSVTMELLKSEDLGNCTRLKILAKITSTRAGGSIQSGYSEAIDILVLWQAGSWEIRDIHGYAEPYFTSFRGDIETISNPNYWYEVSQEELTAKQQQKTASATSVAQEAQSSMQITSITQPASSNATLHELDKSEIVSWARSNYNKRTGQIVPGNDDVSYYDFSQISGNWDCTNFASHALLAGGAVMNETSTSGSTAWYFNSINDRTSSWSGVDKFHYFLTHNRTLGPAGVEMAYAQVSPSLRGFELGDIVQFKQLAGTTWRHTTIITQFNGNEAHVTGRTDSYYCNDNEAVSDIAARYTEGTRVIHLLGYYE